MQFLTLAALALPAMVSAGYGSLMPTYGTGSESSSATVEATGVTTVTQTVAYTTLPCDYCHVYTSQPPVYTTKTCEVCELITQTPECVTSIYTPTLIWKPHTTSTQTCPVCEVQTVTTSTIASTISCTTCQGWILITPPASPTPVVITSKIITSSAPVTSLVTKPAIVTSVVTKPAVTVPVVTKPAVTVTKPAVTVPAVTKSTVTVPVVTKPVAPVVPVSKPVASATTSIVTPKPSQFTGAGNANIVNKGVLLALGAMGAVALA